MTSFPHFFLLKNPFFDQFDAIFIKLFNGKSPFTKSIPDFRVEFTSLPAWVSQLPVQPTTAARGHCAVSGVSEEDWFRPRCDLSRDNYDVM